jgi:hypothetical protein
LGAGWARGDRSRGGLACLSGRWARPRQLRPVPKKEKRTTHGNRSFRRTKCNRSERGYRLPLGSACHAGVAWTRGVGMVESGERPGVV